VELSSDVVQRACDGDAEAFRSLVESHWLALVRFARSIVGESDAEDVVQDSFVVAWKKLKALENPDSFHPWMMRIVARRCFRRAGLLARFFPWVDLSGMREPSVPPSTGEFEVERILSLLPPRQRAVMHLTVIEGMSDGEIGRLLGIRADSVRSHRRRARQALASMLDARRDSAEEYA
jgi:RNA polymerase sigma-70 factor (ECF subfamily)